MTDPVDPLESPGSPGRTDEPPPEPSRLRRVLMKVFGPADLAEEHQHNPLTGTKYERKKR